VVTVAVLIETVSVAKFPKNRHRELYGPNRKQKIGIQEMIPKLAVSFFSKSSRKILGLRHCQLFPYVSWNGLLDAANGANQPALARFHKILRPLVIDALSNTFTAAQLAIAVIAA